MLDFHLSFESSVLQLFDKETLKGNIEITQDSYRKEKKKHF